MDGSKVLTTELIFQTDGPPVRADARSCAPDSQMPVIVVCPGFMGYRRWGFFPWVSELLAKRGYHVVTISFSHSGTDDETGMITRPDEFAADKVSTEIRDLGYVLDGIGSERFPFNAAPERGLLGHSRGGSICILAAAGFPEVSSLVTWSTPSRLDRYTDRRKREWKLSGALEFNDTRSPAPLRLDYSYYEDIDSNRERYDLPAAASRLDTPHLVVHGDRDAAVSISEAEAFFALPARGERRMEKIHGCGHTFGVTHPMTSPTPALERTAELTAAWFARTLVPAGGAARALRPEHDGGKNNDE